MSSVVMIHILSVRIQQDYCWLETCLQLFQYFHRLIQVFERCHDIRRDAQNTVTYEPDDRLVRWI